MSLNPFGPQGANAALTVPTPSALRYGTALSFVQNATSCGANDGTVLDAAFFNNLLLNLNYLVASSGLTTADRGDSTIIQRAVAAQAQALLATLVPNAVAAAVPIAVAAQVPNAVAAQVPGQVQAALPAAFTAYVLGLPTTLPASPGVLWLNAGALSVS